MKLFTVIGVRPQFIKAAPVSRAIRTRGIEELLIHTGQHHDPGMSSVFFEELGIPEPAHHLGIHGGTHGVMTGAMLEGIEKLLLSDRPDAVMVYGDTNSTLAGALAASKLHIPVIHVEAGLRSFNKRMPEEINRICTDHVSALLFCSSETGASLLTQEGIRDGVHIAGDVMADVFQHSLERVRMQPERARRVLNSAGVSGGFGLMTIHRAENTDDPSRMKSIFEAITAAGKVLLFPIHPRTSAILERSGLILPDCVRRVEPLGYLDMVAMLDAADFVLTDSGGLQKEAYWAACPCITARDETEWTETVTAGWNVLTGADSALLRQALDAPPRAASRPPLYGDGQAADRIAVVVYSFLSAAAK